MIDINTLVRENIKALKPYSSARDEFSDSEGIFLDANENPFGKFNRYPDPYQRELKQAIGEYKSIDTSSIFIGNGSDEVIDLLFRIFCNPGVDKALTFSPTYGMYDVSAAINDVELIKVELDIIERIIANFNGIVLVDEAYLDFCDARSTTELIEKYPNLIVSQTMSKARGLAAARVGIAFSNPKMIALLNKVKPPYNVSLLNQQAAFESFRNTKQFEENRKTILAEKEKLEKELLDLDLVVRVYPSDANFFLVEVNDANHVYQSLVNQKIVVRNRNQIVRNCIRITVGSPAENQQLINALKNIEL